jgi:integrase
VRGHVRKRHWTDRGGKDRHGWEYVIELAKVGEKRQQQTKGGFRTKKAAETALQKDLEARSNGSHVEPCSTSFADFANEKWLPWVKEEQKPTTHALYAGLMRRHVLPVLGAVPLQEVSGDDIASLYLRLKRGGKDRKPLGGRSLHNVSSAVRSLFKHAIALEKVSRSPAAGIAAGNGTWGGEEPAHWDSDSVAAFLDLIDARFCKERTVTESRASRSGGTYTYSRTFAPDPMQRALWYLFATSGMRRAEVCGLRWRDVDLSRGELKVKQTRVLAGAQVCVTGTKTRRGQRGFAIEPETLKALQDWKQAQAREHEAFKDHWEDNEGYVFTRAVLFRQPHRFGVPVRPDWVTHAFKDLVVSNSLPELNLHGTRHSWATAAVESGEDTHSVANQLGHSDSRVTERIYIHTIQRVQDKTALRVGALLSSNRASAGGQREDRAAVPA